MSCFGQGVATRADMLFTLAGGQVGFTRNEYRGVELRGVRNELVTGSV